MLCHPGIEATLATAKSHKYTCRNVNFICDSCALSKARQKNVNKVATTKAGRAAERLCLDISTFKYPSLGGNRHWLLIIDEFTAMKWSFFLKNKADLTNTVIPFLDKLKNTGYMVHHLHMDNAGENSILAKQLKLQGSNIQLEFTAPNTPQQNRQIERAFASLYGKIRAMFSAAGIINEI
jgi:transposase InsO family protein